MASAFSFATDAQECHYRSAVPPRPGSGYVFWKLHARACDGGANGCNGARLEPWLAGERAEALRLLIEAQARDYEGSPRAAIAPLLRCLASIERSVAAGSGGGGKRGGGSAAVSGLGWWRWRFAAVGAGADADADGAPPQARRKRSKSAAHAHCAASTNGHEDGSGALLAHDERAPPLGMLYSVALCELGAAMQSCGRLDWATELYQEAASSWATTCDASTDARARVSGESDHSAAGGTLALARVHGCAHAWLNAAHALREQGFHRTALERLAELAGDPQCWQHRRKSVAGVEGVYRAASWASGVVPLRHGYSGTAGDDADVHAQVMSTWQQMWDRLAIEVGSRATYSLVLMLFAIGHGEEASRLLPEFGIRFHPAPELWRRPLATTNREHSRREWDAGAPVRLVRAAVPRDLGERLRHGFRPDSAFWRGVADGGTGYHSPDRGYFSFWFPLVPPTAGAGSGEHRSVSRPTPSNAVEELILRLLPLTGLELARAADNSGSGGDSGKGSGCASSGRRRIVGAEWWVHSRAAQHTWGHSLHFDTAENMLHKAELCTPEISSVIFLDDGGGAGSGPTVVFDQRLDDERNAGKAWQVWPMNDAALFFDGDLLHGVLPAPVLAGNASELGGATRHAADNMDTTALLAAAHTAAAAAAAAPPHAPTTTATPPTAAAAATGASTGRRLTLMIGWWASDVCGSGQCEEYGPCAPIPAHAAWLHELPPAGTGSGGSSRCDDGAPHGGPPHELQVRVVEPAWVGRGEGVAHEQRGTCERARGVSGQCMRTEVRSLVDRVSNHRSAKHADGNGNGNGSGSGSGTGTGGGTAAPKLIVPGGISDQSFWLCTEGSQQFRDHLLQHCDPWSSTHALAGGGAGAGAAPDPAPDPDEPARGQKRVAVQFGAGPLGIALEWQAGSGVVVEAVGGQAAERGVRAGDTLVAANGHPVMPGVTDAELAQILDLESGRAPHMVFERPCAA